MLSPFGQFVIPLPPQQAVGQQREHRREDNEQALAGDANRFEVLWHIWHFHQYAGMSSAPTRTNQRISVQSCSDGPGTELRHINSRPERCPRSALTPPIRAAIDLGARGGHITVSNGYSVGRLPR